jgi:hypothetical protein
MSYSLVRGALSTFVFGVVCSWATFVTAQDFYKGKSIRLIVATTPGGGFDAYSRMLARHMGKHIAGNPTLVVENMPGAAFMIGTNYLYRQAKPDGLTLGNWIGTLVLHQVMGRSGIEFDARKFEYVGAPIKNHDTCIMTRSSGIDSMQKWMSSPTPIKMGATPPGLNPVRQRGFEGRTRSAGANRLRLQGHGGDPLGHRRRRSGRSLRSRMGFEQSDVA